MVWGWPLLITLPCFAGGRPSYIRILLHGLVVTRVLWVTQVLLQLQHESKFLLSTVWVKLWGPVSAAVFLGKLLGLNLVRGFFAELVLL